ncbi:DUF2255 family protein [Streptomyces sp. NPDC057074]|uniref:DUF2255 family protein n=1 Tax=Streptomyces sp. NPDC057074 TaxID=3346015 RepID=UPI00362CF359
MTTWTPHALEQLAAADELHIAPRRDDGSLRKPTTIWVVTDGDQVFVRSWRGTDGAWWKTARATSTGHVSADGIDTDVTFTPVTDPAANDRVDDAYRAKYGHYTGYVEPMTAEQARATTLRVTPQT